jgi:hypothetical protein
MVGLIVEPGSMTLWIRIRTELNCWIRTEVKNIVPFMGGLIVEPGSNNIERIDHNHNGQAGEESGRHIDLPRRSGEEGGFT